MSSQTEPLVNDIHAAFWTPDRHVEEERWQPPSQAELATYWRCATGNQELLELPDTIYGACNVPPAQPTAFAVLDLCEVVRETGIAISRLGGGGLKEIFNHEKGAADYGASFLNFQRDDMIQITVQLMMDHDLVDAVKFHEALTAFMQRWKKADAYIVADTSTLPGCENNTIDFLERYYPSCFDGILLPRNHDGNGQVTKAMAFAATQEAIANIFGDEIYDVPVVYIEDTPHHTTTFKNAFPDSKIFMPEYDWNTNHDQHTDVTIVPRHLGTVDSFIAADNYLMR